MNPSLLSVQNVEVRYPNQAVSILKDISFTVQENESILLVGASGCGKSTLTLCIQGLIPKRIPCQFSGNIEIMGQSMENLSLAEVSQQIGMVFQNPEAQMLIAETVEEEVAFGLEMRQVPKADMDPIITHYLQEVDLLHKRKEKTQHLSMGQKQKLALAAILALQPKILILDEPSAALDPESTQHLFHILRKRKEHGNLSLILIEHKLEQVIPWIDRVFFMSTSGFLVSQQSPPDFFKQHQALLQAEGVAIPSSLQTEKRLIPSSKSSQALPRSSINMEPKIATEIEIIQLSSSFSKKQVLSNINLRIPKGNLVALVGENGAGKTTLARHLIKDLKPQKNSIFLQGNDILSLSHQELTQKVGYVFQNPEHQFLTDTVLEEFMLGFRLQKQPEFVAKEKSLSFLKQWGLFEQRNAHPFSLSQGQKRRLSLLTMLYLGQEILILDEPTWGMDQNNISLFFHELLLLQKQQKTLLLITHDMDLVQKYADQVVVLHQGSVLFQGTPSSLFQQENLLQTAHLIKPFLTIKESA